MKVLVINCGSSSLKYQLIDMDGEKVLCKGLCERIGMESSMITHEANGHKATTPAIFPTHTEAFAEVVKKMTTGEGKCIDDVSEINAIGHRVVHGGEKFAASARIVEAAGVRAADGVILIDKLVRIQSVIVRAVSVQRADNDL